MENLYFELETETNVKVKSLEVKNFDHSMKLVEEILDNNPAFEIRNDNDLKKAKSLRASLNKIIKQIDRRRIDTIDIITSDFSNQCNSLKAPLQQRANQYSEQIKSYEKSPVINEAKVYKATITFTNPDMVLKLQNFCLENNLTLTIE